MSASITLENGDVIKLSASPACIDDVHPKKARTAAREMFKKRFHDLYPNAFFRIGISRNFWFTVYETWGNPNFLNKRISSTIVLSADMTSAKVGATRYTVSFFFTT